jgi:hypothetical protein
VTVSTCAPVASGFRPSLRLQDSRIALFRFCGVCWRHSLFRDRLGRRLVPLMCTLVESFAVKFEHTNRQGSAPPVPSMPVKAMAGLALEGPSGVPT